MNVGIVGLGSIGARHARNALALGHDIKVYDPLTQSDFKFERQLYDWCDAAIIATPTFHHEAGLRACVERGKHCLVEKPISTSLGQLEGLLRTAAEKNLVVMMGNNLRFHAAVKQAKAWIEGGKITPQWANFICATLTEKPDYLSDGVILNTGSHEVDMALHLFGPALVVAATGRWNEHSDAMADFVLLHNNGVRSSFHLDFVTEREIRQFWIGGLRSNIYVNLPARVATLTPSEGGATGEELSGGYDWDYEQEMAEFLARCGGKGDGVGATGEDGLATLRLLLDIRRKVGLP